MTTEASATEGSNGAPDVTNQNPDGDAGRSNAAPAASSDPAGDSGSQNAGGMTDKERELLRESMSRKEKIKELESKLTEYSTQLKNWEGLNPEDVRKLVQEKRDAELKQMEKKGEWDKIRQQMLDAHTAEKQTLAQKIEELNQKLGAYAGQIDQLTVGQAFSSSKFIADELVLTPSKARTVYGSHFERDAEGRVIAYDKPSGSEGRAPLVDGQGNPLSFDAALKKLVEVDPDRDALLKAKIKQGADSGTAGVKTKSSDPAGNTSGVSRIADAIRSGGLKKFARP
jgi:hypothetical protein